MTEPIIRVFDVLDQAQRAREALLAAGYPADQIELRIANDEAGPVEGNFYVGNSSDQSHEHTYDRNYAHVRQGAECIVVVGAADLSGAGAAASILARFGGREMR